MSKTPTAGGTVNGEATITADAFSAALNGVTRRVLLFHVLHHGPSPVEELVSAIRATTTADDRQAGNEELVEYGAVWALYHVHLPKLESLGIISWDRDTDVVSLEADPSRLDAWLSVALAEDVHGAVAGVPGEARAETDSIRVLYVEDYGQLADLVAERFGTDHPDLDVVVATNAVDAIGRLADEPFDCIVSDYDMPAMNGLDFLRAVRESDPDVPFLLYTGMGSEETASEAIAHGVSDYLRKGTDGDQFDALADRVRRIVGDAA